MTDKPLCSIDGCGKPAYGHGWCNTHWRRWRVHGDPLGGGRRYHTPEEAFAARVKPHILGCHFWTGSITTDGYGNLGVRGKNMLAHRYAWECANGPIPEGLIVCHTCDQRNCVNPAHMFLGTDADNMADRDAKGRQSDKRGEKNGKSKITVDDVRAIRDDPRVYKLIAKDYGIKRVTVSRIKRRINWAHVA